ncbi:MAG TPA: PAS domain S-box protein, partial [Anaerolineales bacterium]|nr:PAS domain S-box protein [Anaerolineales bacterium]
MSIFQRLLSLLKPPTFADPEENRLARNLYNFSGIVGIFTLLVTPILVYAAVSPEEKRMVLLLDGGWVLSTPVFLWMIRRRRVRLAGYVYTSLTFLISLVFIFRYYDNVLASAFVLLGITALAGQALGNRGILVFGCLGFIAQVGKLIAGLQGWGMPEISLLELKSDAAVSLLFYCLLGGMLWTITRSLSTALQQSRHNEMLLQEKNAVLQSEIRERSQVQTALQASENNYRQLLEQAADGILIFDPNGAVISANSRGCEIFGVSREELLQLSVRDLFSTHELPSLRERVAEMQKGKTFIIERAFTRRDGITMSVETSSKMLDQGQFLAIVRDITARKETEKSLNQQHARLKALHDIALALFIVQDDEALMEIILDQAMQMLGVTLSAFALADANNQIVARKVRSSLATVDTETLKALQNIQSQLAIKAYQTLQPAVFEDYEGKEGCRIHENVFLYASACIPMLVSGKCVGILAFGHTRPQARFTPEDIQMGVLLAQLAAVALNNIQLLRESQMLAQNETLLNSITRT